MNNLDKERTFRLFTYIFLIFGVSATAIDPLIPVISKKLEVGYDKIGLALFIGSIFSLLSTFISGKLSDRFDIKKITITGLLLLFFGYLLFGLHLNFIIFILVMILIRSGFSIIDTSMHSHAAKICSNNHTPIFLKLEIFWYLGAVIGPLLISANLFLKLDSKYTFLLFSFSFAILLVLFYKICPTKEQFNKLEMSVEKSFSKDNNNKNKSVSIKNPVVIMISLVLFFYMGSIFGLSTWLTTYFSAFNMDISISSMILSFYWMLSVFGLLIARKILDRTNEITLLFFGCLLGTICITVFSFIPVLYIKIIFLMFQAIFFSIIFSLSTSISASENPSSVGTILGFNIAFAFAGPIVFQPILGYVAEYIGKDYIMYVVFTGTVLGLILAFILYRILNTRNVKTK